LDALAVAKRPHVSGQLNDRERQFDLILRPSTPDEGSTLFPDGQGLLREHPKTAPHLPVGSATLSGGSAAKAIVLLHGADARERQTAKVSTRKKPQRHGRDFSAFS
jgi:hypothetical protein